MTWEEQEKYIEERIQLQDALAKEYLIQLQSLRCAICKEPGQFMRLLGGRHVVLCTDHLNAWTEYIMQHELSKVWDDAQSDFYVALNQHSEEVARECNRIWQATSTKIYELSGEWLKEEIMKWPAR